MEVFKEEILYKESRIKVLVDKKSLIEKAFNELLNQRALIEEYINKDTLFKITLEPHKIQENAPEIVREMAEGALIADVGPMAAVAGTIAEFICRRLIRENARIAVIENGGDIFAYTKEPVTVGLFSGTTHLVNNLALILTEKNTPLALCSSSSLLGHSISFGDCDLATVFSKRGCIADTVATAVCNRVTHQKDIEKALQWASNLNGVEGVIIVKDDKIGMIGDIPELIKSTDEKIKEKVTKDDSYQF